ncbi:MAG: methionyl-tRNA formyltransferase [Bryobacteraceae bacterium]
MRLVFLGTPAFAVPTLERVLEAGHRVEEVYTQPDRPKGRGGQLAISPVKEAALHLGLPVHQPPRIRRPEIVEELRALEAEAMVVVGYGQIIPQTIIDLPRFGILNVHGSLLPKYRGAAPLQWAIANGETVTGVTTMRIDAGLDTGNMLLNFETAIGAGETAVELGERLAQAGADLLVETLGGLERGTITPRPQNGAEATLAPILTKEDGRIDWNWPAAKIHNRMRGFQPWPGAYTTFRGQLLHIWKARPRADDLGGPGKLGTYGKLVLVACGSGTSLELSEVQLEGRKRIAAQAFANGHRFAGNEMLGGEARFREK